VAKYRDAGITCLNLRLPGHDSVDKRIAELERAVAAVRG
jgi:hypothetical protein